MYENEYGTGTNNGSTQGTGTYTDYAGYTRKQSEGSYEETNRKYAATKVKNDKWKRISACVALVLVGLIVGGVTTSAYLSAKSNKQIAATQNQTDSEDVSETKPDTETSEESAVLSKGDDAEEVSPKNLPDSGSLSVADIAEQNLSCVVAITNKGVREVRSMWGTFAQESESAGSGVIIGKTDKELLILTNYHVVADNSELSVVFSWEENNNADDADIITALVKDYDANRDIAVISIDMDALSEDTQSKITVAKIGSSDDLALGEQVVAIGNALGYGQSVTTGIVSALNRTITTSSVDNSSKTVSNTFIQTDAAINPGNSGGALFNMKGELVGINSAKNGGSSVEGMGYAIPISEIQDSVEVMMNQEVREKVDEANRGYLGVSIVDVTSEISSTYGMPQGVYIASVNADSAAEKAGLEKEEIITAVNGKTVLSGSELKAYLAYYAIGDTVTITVSHRGEEGYQSRDVEVVLGTNDDITPSQNIPNISDENEGVGLDDGNDDGKTEKNYGFSFSFGN